MGKFKRASLEGSEELFRPTRPAGEHDEVDEPIQEIVEPKPSERRLKAIHLTADEIDLLIAAIQIAKYPERAQQQKLPLYQHERFDALRDKLQANR